MYLHTSVVYMYADQCMLYLNHVIAVVVAEFERPKVAGLPHPNAEANAVEGAICESANREIEAQLVACLCCAVLVATLMVPCLCCAPLQLLCGCGSVVPCWTCHAALPQ